MALAAVNAAGKAGTERCKKLYVAKTTHVEGEDIGPRACKRGRNRLELCHDVLAEL
ncbi:hypothetical protein [uncultured Paraburkholderia sp.]|uniref:hypothetical protein n=1 Tax=uncultured Paraburkholderia sp. TaxID=1822466 RepID=UPI00259A08E7|nr:hypothetical protein [uncultured Paraburkholderia sp.]